MKNEPYLLSMKCNRPTTFKSVLTHAMSKFEILFRKSLYCTRGPLVTLILGSGKTCASRGRVTRINNNTSFFSLKNRVSKGPTL